MSSSRVTLRPATQKSDSEEVQQVGGEVHGHILASGLELQLTVTPSNIAPSIVKEALLKHFSHNHKDMHKIKIQGDHQVYNDFLVIAERSSEQRFLDELDGRRTTQKLSLIVPDGPRFGKNVAEDLIGERTRLYSEKYGKLKIYIEKAEKVLVPQTTSRKFHNLRSDPFTNQDSRLQDGTIGSLIKVSLGNFDENDYFESAWSYEETEEYSSFSYLGDNQPAKFRVCLGQLFDEGAQTWEWMDLLESNIQGVIFGTNRRKGIPNYKCAYFVIDKAPQFYQRKVSSDGLGSVISRVSGPSGMERGTNENVPWKIQFSRVIRVEYGRHQYFDESTYYARLSPQQRQTMCIMRCSIILPSHREPSDLSNTIQKNFTDIKNISAESGFCSCQIGLMSLFLNGNILASSDESTKVIASMRKKRLETTCVPYCVLCEKVHRFAQTIGKSQHRSLHRFWDNAESRSPDRLLARSTYTGTLKSAFDSVVRIDGIGGTPDRDPAAPRIFEALIHPSHVEIHGPVDPPVNSVFEQYHRRIDSFMRVKFMDNNTETLKPETGISLRGLIANRVVPILEGKIQVFGMIEEQYNFLGYTLSSLKKRKGVWFFRSSDKAPANAKCIRDSIGDWSHRTETNSKLANDPAKWGARTSLAFTSSYPVATLSRHQWNVRKDVGNKEYPNTDGCGVITQSLCDHINDQLAAFGFSRSQAFQIRFGGFKGVVYAGPDSFFDGEDANCLMLLRDSQHKFITNSDDSEMTLRVASTIGDCQQSLFMSSALKAFEDAGASVKTIERIFSDTYEHLRLMTPAGVRHLQQICRVSTAPNSKPSTRTAFLSLAAQLLESNVPPRNYACSFLWEYLFGLAKSAKNKDQFQIPIPESYCLLGLTDDFDMLGGWNWVYVRAGGKTITGRVLIYRDPVLHIGDIQWAYAISDGDARRRMEEQGYHDIEERFRYLHRIDNAIFFSQQWEAKKPPLPNRLSGGDLDGDRFEVLTDKCGFWDESTYRTFPPPLYDDNDVQSSMKKRQAHGNFDIGDLARFLGDYMENDCFGDLQNLLMSIADQRPDGMQDPQVQYLAPWLSKAVDYPKSGKGVDLMNDVVQNPVYQHAVETKPTFLRSPDQEGLYDFKGEYYRSEKLLGRLHEQIKAKRPALNSPAPIEIHAGLRSAIQRSWNWHSSFGRHSQFLQEEAKEYSQKLEQSYPLLSEIDILLEGQQEDFLHEFLDRLVLKVLDVLFESHFEPVDASIFGTQVRPDSLETDRYFTLKDHRTGSTLQDAVRIYRLYLAQFCEEALAEIGRTRHKGYPFLCLYALYCREAPIVHVGLPPGRHEEDGLDSQVYCARLHPKAFQTA